MAASAMANIGLNLLLVPRWGIAGAALGNTGSIILLNLIATFSLHRKTALHRTVFGTIKL